MTYRTSVHDENARVASSTREANLVRELTDVRAELAWTKLDLAAARAECAELRAILDEDDPPPAASVARPTLLHVVAQVFGFR